MLRTSQYAWWRSALGVVLGLSLFWLMTTLISQLVIMIAWATTAAGQSYQTYFTDAYAFRRPAGMLALNLALAALIPASWLLITMVHQVAPRWLSSVRPRLRWRLLAMCLGVAVIATAVSLVFQLLLEPVHVHLQQGFWAFLIVIILTSPIQAAGEEVFFRGYLMQALGSLYGRPWFGVIVSSVVFAFFHGSQNVPLFVDRLAFGLLAAALVWRTGGLEAGIAAHVINNVFAYTFAGLTGTIAGLRALEKISWLTAVVDVGGFALFAVLAFLVARWRKVQTRVDLSTVQALR
jgi:membrane protease YdiL (CAAX protease family)